MPFSIRKQGKKFQVINSETGDVKGEHASEADAKKQLAALYVNVPDARKGLQDMDIITKAVNATIEDTSANAQEFPGTFLVELSNESLDRDGETLKGDEWETPLPQQITFVNDHTHKMASVVGSAKPELVGGKILCKGEWAATDNAQDTRKVIKHVPYVSVAYREKRNQKAGTVTRELVNGSFVVVPSNIKARVLASKAFDEMDDETKEFIKSIVQETLSLKADSGDGKKPYGDVTYADPGYQSDNKKRYPLDTEKHVRAAWSYINQGDNSKAYSAEQLSSIKGKIKSAAKKFGITIGEDSKDVGPDWVLIPAGMPVFVKDASGTLTELSQAPDGAPPKEADSQADPPEDEAAALDQIKAAAMSMQTRHLVDERELDYA